MVIEVPLTRGLSPLIASFINMILSLSLSDLADRTLSVVWQQESFCSKEKTYLRVVCFCTAAGDLRYHVSHTSVSARLEMRPGAQARDTQAPRRESVEMLEIILFTGSEQNSNNLH